MLGLLVFLCVADKMDSSFVDHEEEVPTMNTYSCNSCGKTYKTLANLKRHLDDTHSDKLFQCDK